MSKDTDIPMNIENKYVKYCDNHFFPSYTLTDLQFDATEFKLGVSLRYDYK
jgi:hypothetical protein